MSEDKLAQLLKTGSDWERIKTTIPGLFVLKMPAYRNSPARLAVELNPIDEFGNPTKKRGMVIRSSQELEEYVKVFKYDKLSPLLKSIDKVNPSTRKPAKPGQEVLEL